MTSYDIPKKCYVHFSLYLTIYSSIPYFLSFITRMLWEMVSNTLLMSKQTASTALQPSTQPVMISQKIYTRLVKHDFPFMNPYGLPLTTFFSYLLLFCLERVSRTSCSITFLGMEMRLTGLQFPGSSFLSFLKFRVKLAILQSSSTSPICQDTLKMIESSFTFLF